MKIAYDCQGGDRAPEVVIKGALQAKEAYDIEPIFFGNKDVLLNYDGVDESEVVHCSDVILQEESPAIAIRKKKDSAIVKAMYALKTDVVDGVISAGSTGALLAGGMFIVGREADVERAALPVVLSLSGKKKVLLDVGANMDATPEMLLSFAKMASTYLARVEQVDSPSVALLNVGSEEGKGNKQIKEAYDLFKASDLNFQGNLEAREVLFPNVDIVVCDGFAGNILLKSIEGVIGFVQQGIQKTLKEQALSKESMGLIAGVSKSVLGELDYTRYGGVPLLGLKKPVFKAHGSSDEKAIFSATEALMRMIENR